MLELSKKILKRVSFDINLFHKELLKSISWMQSKEDIQKLKEWCLQEFGNSHQLILQKVFREDQNRFTQR
jgi:coproporphyrinogen III oxidase-like Fe-S oxidoreductase